MRRFFSVIITVIVLLFSFRRIAQAQSQTVYNGQATSAVAFPGPGCSYRWTNNNTSIGLPSAGIGDIASFIAVNNGNSPITATITATPVYANYAYIAEPDSNVVRLVNTGTNTPGLSIPVGTRPMGVSISPDFSRVYVANQSSNNVSVINTATNTVINTIDVGSKPLAVIISPDGGTAYVSNQGDHTVSVINTITNTVTTTISIGEQCAGLAISPDGKKLYVRSILPSNILIYDTSTKHLIGTIPFSQGINSFDYSQLLISPDGGKLYAPIFSTNSPDNQGYYTPVAVINTTTYDLSYISIYQILESVNILSLPTIALSPDGSLLYISYNQPNFNVTTPPEGNYVAVYNTVQDKLIAKNIPIPGFSGRAIYGIGIGVSPDGNQVYAMNSTSISVLDASGGFLTLINGMYYPFADGNFFGKTTCTGKPFSFNITVQPTPQVSTIVTKGVPSPLSTTNGTASASTSFTVAGFKLTEGVLLSAPAGFELSKDNISFNTTITVGAAGDLNDMPVYIRLSASAAVGSYSGNVVASSAGATNQQIALIGTVSPAGSTVPNQTVYNGAATQAVSLPGNSCLYTWFSDQDIGVPAASPTNGGTNLPSFTAVNTGTTPITATISVRLLTKPFNTPIAWVVNQLSAKVWVFSVPDNQVYGAFQTDLQPYAVVVNKVRDRLFVTNKSSGTVSVAKLTYFIVPPPQPPVVNAPVVATIKVGKSPEGLVLSPDERTLYVVNSDDATISVINTKTSSVTATIVLNSISPTEVAISPDGSKLYVVNSGSGYVSVVSTATNTVTGVIGVGANPQSIAISPDGSKLYVSNKGSNSVSVVNTANNSVATVNVKSQPQGIAISPDGSLVYVANQGSNNVTIINTADNSIVQNVDVGTSPSGLSVSVDGSYVYVTNYGSNNISVISTANNTVTATFNSDNLDGAGPVNDRLTGPMGCFTPFTFTITVLPTPPTIIATGNLATLTTTFGVPSASTSFNVSGLSLTEGILVTPPNGFEVSADNVNFSNTLTVGKSGNLASTPVYVRLAANTPVGTYSGDITLSSAKASPVSEPTSASTVTDAVPAILYGKVTGKITACAGTPSASPNIQQFTVSAVALNGVFSASTSSNFEVSLNPNTGYSRSMDISNTATVGNTIIYVRSSASAVGSITGFVKLGSPGATPQQVAVYGLAYPVPVADPVNSQTVVAGQPTAKVTFTGTGNTFTWTNDNTQIGLAASGTGDIATFTAVNSTNSPIKATVTATPVSVPLAYVANQGENSVSVISVNDNQLIKTIPVGSAPRMILINPDGSKVYVLNQGTNDVSVINTGNNLVVATVKVGHDTEGMAFSPDGSSLFVFNSIDGTITEINTASNTVASTTDAGPFPPGTIYSPDGNLIYAFDAAAGIFNVTNKTTGKLVGLPASSTVQGLALSPTGDKVYISDVLRNKLLVFDAATNQQIAAIAVGSKPQGISLSVDGLTLYVTNGEDNTVSVISTATNKVINIITAGHFPNAVATTGGTGCGGIPAIFTFTVNPPVPTVNISGLPDALTTVYGFASLSTTFTVSGTNLSEAILVTPPPGFEISTDDVNYSGSLTIGTGGNVPPMLIYIRLAAGTPVGSYSGNITASSLDAADAELPMPTCTVTPPLQTIKVGPVTGSIYACSGSASSSPNIQQFKVSGLLLTGDIVASAPAGFELSLAPGTGYGASATLVPTKGIVSSTIIYVRSSATASGNISGDVKLTSNGAIPKTATVKAAANITPTANRVADQNLIDGDLSTAVTFTGTANLYSWTNDTPGIGLPISGFGNIASFIATNKGNTRLSATVTVTPTAAALAYIANYLSNSVSVINTGNNKVVATVPLPANSAPYAIAISPDGRSIYVANQSSGKVSVIDAFTNTVKTTFGAGPNPCGIAISPDGNFLYISNGNSQQISIVDTRTGAPPLKVGVGTGPEGIVVSPDGSRVYVVNRNSTNVSVIDVTKNTEILPRIATGLSPEGITISPDGGTIYVSNYNSKSVTVINTADNTVAKTITVGTNPRGITLSLDGSILYVANGGDNTVSVINAADYSLIKTVTVGKGPQGLALSKDGSLIFVANSLINSVSVINAATYAVSAPITVGGTPVSFGNFISGGIGCTGPPVSFQITVDPSSPFITVAGNLTALRTVYGSPSVALSFTVSAIAAKAGIMAGAPPGFEISADNVHFSSSITVGGAGDIAAIPVYIRLAAASPAGKYSGNVVLSSSGFNGATLATAESTVEPAPLTIKADDKTRPLATANPPLTATYTGFVNNDGPASLATPPLLSTAALFSSPAGKYPITAQGAASPNYTFQYVDGVLTIGTSAGGFTIPNTFSPNNDGHNDTWAISFLSSYPNCTVSIFSRYGAKVFSSVGYPLPWDGRLKGADLPTGTYYYLIDLKNGHEVLSGSITLIR